MALDAELLSLKSAGTYRFERDLSEISNTVATISNLRLVVGFSKMGPFNTVKLVTSTAQFIKLYGNIDRSLEKKGSFFHRSALVALSAGPILCLNLLNLDPDLDQVVEKSFSISSGKKNCDSITLPLQSLYNTDKFWYTSDEAYLDAIDNYLGNAATTSGENTDWCNGLLHFANVGKKPVSILVKKASDYYSKGYQLTLNEWYGDGNVPEYLNGTSYASDYLVEVYVVGGDFGPAMTSYNVTSSLDLDEDNENGKCDVLKGYTVNSTPYKRFSADVIYQDYFDKDKGFVRGVDSNGDINDSNLTKFLNLSSVDLRAKYVGSLIPNFCDKLGRNIWIQKLVNDDTDTIGLLCTENVNLIEDVDLDKDFIDEKIDLIGHNLFAEYYDDLENSENDDMSFDFLSYKFDTKVNDVFTEYTFIDPTGFYYDSACETKPYKEKDNEVIIKKVDNAPVVGDYLVSGFYTENDEHHSRLTRVITVKNIFKKNDNQKYILISCSDVIHKTAWSTDDDVIIKVKPIDKICNYFQWISLSGFQARKDAMPNGENERQDMILDMIREEPEFTSTVSNLYKALIDRDYVQFRYVIDTFGLGLEEECKNVYTKLCQGRKSALAIINCPSQADFKKSLDPSFVNKVGGVETEYISKGGDLSKNPSFLFSLPTLENGASWGAYYYPYLRITDLSAAKSVPPAAYVSNLYIQKYSRGFAWSIVAGQKRGVISGNQVVGVEATLVRDNRDWLEPMGINAIIWEPGVGVEIYANKTAKQSPVSALSSAHVREAAIYIQDGVESILKKYVFEFNTAQTRLEIKTLVDEFLNTMKSNGGLYDFKTVMDTTNNTNEVIDNNRGVIDIYVEIVRGMEIIAQRLTILKTGAISAGGFE